MHRFYPISRLDRGLTLAMNQKRYGYPRVVNQSTKRVQQANACLIGEAWRNLQIGWQGINIENDNCFVLSEAQVPVRLSMRCRSYMGTSMEEVVINGQPWKGRTGLAGEWGHDWKN